MLPRRQWATRSLATIAALMAAAGPARGDTSWNNGNANNLWSDPGNWSAGLPDSADIAGFPHTIPGGNGSISLTGINANAKSLFFHTGNYSLNDGSLTLADGTVTVEADNPFDTVIIATPLAGASGLTKNGSSTLTLSGNNTYTGNTNVNDGTLILGSMSSPIPGNSTVTVSTGATLSLLGTHFIGPLAGGGSVTMSGSGTVLSVGVSSGISTFSGVISGSGGLTKTGSGGDLTLTGANTYTGDTRVDAGFLDLRGADERLPNTTNLIVASSAAFGLFPSVTTQTIAGLFGEGSVQFANPAGTNLRVGFNDASAVFNGNFEELFGGIGSLTKIGDGTLTLNGNNAYSGDTTIEAGRLVMGPGVHSIPDASTVHVAAAGFGTLDMNDQAQVIGALAGDGLVFMGDAGTASLQTGFNNQSTTFAGNVLGSGSFDKTGSGTLTLTGNTDWTVPVSISNGAIRTGPFSGALRSTTVTVNPSGTLDANGNLAVIGALTGSGPTTLGNGGALNVGVNDTSTTYSGSISGGTVGEPARVEKTGSGTLTLAGASTYTGTTRVTEGTLALTNPNALSNTAATLFTATIDTHDVALLLGSAITVNNAIAVDAQGSGTATLGTADFDPGPVNARFSGDLFLQSNATLQAGSTDRTTFAGKITGTGNLTVTSPFAPGRRIVLDRPTGLPNDFTGTITIDDDAHLQLGVANPIGNRTVPDAATIVFKNPGSSLRLAPAGSGDSETVGSLVSDTPGAGSVEMFTGDAFTLAIGADDQDHTFSGTIANPAGALSITKVGAGNQTLSGNNTYSGNTHVLAGTLTIAGGTTPSANTLVQGALVIDGGTFNANTDFLIDQGTVNLTGGNFNADVIRFNTGGTFNFTGGTLHTGTYIGDLFNNGGTLAPGHSPGATIVIGNYAQAANATLQIELADPATGPTTSPDPGDDFDQVTVTGNLTLAGTLDVALLDSYDPALGETFTVLAYTSRSGTFDTFNGVALNPDGTKSLAAVFDDVSGEFRLTAAIPGDANLNGEVTIGDLSLLAANFGTTPGLGNWNKGDFNQDGQITIGDLSLLAANFGLTNATAGLTLEGFGISLEHAASLVGLDLSTSGGGGVPEPATLACLLVTPLLLPRRRKH